MSVPSTITAEGIALGMELGPTVFGPIERADIVRYAGASGDFNPIHIDDAYAQAAGAPSVFAMGMLPAGYLAHALSDWFGGPHGLRRFKVRFTTRVWAGDELVCTGKVEGFEDGIARVVLAAHRKGHGPTGAGISPEETALIGEADVEIPIE
jgi:acyl dehydratase